MKIELYAVRYNRTEDERRMGLVDNLAVLGYPVTWSLSQMPDSVMVSLDVADGSKVWEDNGKVWIDEGNNAGVLHTYNGMPTLTISSYYGNVDKYMRIIGIEK